MVLVFSDIAFFHLNQVCYIYAIIRLFPPDFERNAF
jgi:hypothetical protein